MSGKTTPSRRNNRAFRVGGKVYIRMGGKKRVARIVEDRGAIGIGGRRLLRVALSRPNGEVMETFEVPAANVTSAERRVPSQAKTKAHA